MFNFETYTIIVCQSIVRKNAYYKLVVLFINFYYLWTIVFIIHHELQIYYNK